MSGKQITDRKKVLITGVSSGIGMLTLEQLLQDGVQLIAGIRGGLERLKSVFPDGPVAEALKSDQNKITAIDLHMDRPETFETISNLIQSQFDGKLDAVINNAGFGLMGPVENHTVEEMKRQFEVNYFGIVSLTRCLLPFLRQTKGRVINVSSILGRVSMPYYGAYCASKAALEAYTEALYYELKPFGVQVALVEPGGFRTEFTKKVDFGEVAGQPQNPYYQDIQIFHKALTSKGHTFSDDPNKVARLLSRLVSKERIRLRYPIGKDAKFVTFMNHFLPDSWRVGLTHFFFRNFFLKA